MTAAKPSRLVRWSKRLLFSAVALVTLVALVLAVEGYRAKRAWTACRDDLVARGEKLEWNLLAQPAVPADQNFLGTPTLAPGFGIQLDPATGGAVTADTNRWSDLLRRLAWASQLPGPGNWRERTIVDVSEWQTILRAKDPGVGRGSSRTVYGLNPAATPGQSSPTNLADTVPGWAALRVRPPGTPLDDLQFLLVYDREVLDPIRAAAQRTFAEIPLGEDADLEALMSQLGGLKSLVHPFRVSCWTQLLAGNPEAALADVRVMLALSEAAGSQPLLLGVLVKIALLDTTIHTVWAGLAEHRWSDAELIQLEAFLSGMNMVEDVRNSLRGERAFVLARLLRPSATDEGLTGADVDPIRDALRYWPSAVIYRNRINVARAYQFLLIDPLDPAGPCVRLNHRPEEADRRLEFSSHSPYNVFVPMLIPALEKAVEKAALSQASVTLARVACALERHRFAHDEYPETLEQLTPRFLLRLPPDPVQGEPLNYRRDDPGHFVLYSIGLNGRDDGGTGQSTGPASGPARREPEDWVWRSGVAGSPDQVVAEPPPIE